MEACKRRDGIAEVDDGILRSAMHGTERKIEANCTAKQEAEDQPRPQFGQRPHAILERGHGEGQKGSHQDNEIGATQRIECIVIGHEGGEPGNHEILVEKGTSDDDRDAAGLSDRQDERQGECRSNPKWGPDGKCRNRSDDCENGDAEMERRIRAQSARTSRPEAGSTCRDAHRRSPSIRISCRSAMPYSLGFQPPSGPSISAAIMALSKPSILRRLWIMPNP